MSVGFSGLGIAPSLPTSMVVSRNCDLSDFLSSGGSELPRVKAVGLLEKYFGEDDDDDENLLPNTAPNAAGFTFGAPATPQAQMGFAF